MAELILNGVTIREPLKAELIEDIANNTQNFIQKKPIEIANIERRKLGSRVLSIGNYALKYGSLLLLPGESVFTIIEALLELASEENAELTDIMDKIESILEPIRGYSEAINRALLTIKALKISNDNPDRVLNDLQRAIKKILGILRPIMAPASYINNKSQECALKLRSERPEPDPGQQRGQTRQGQ